MSASLSSRQARRIALVAQGFGTRPEALRDVADRVAVFQIDPISVLVRSQYLPAFSRIGPYPRADLDGLAYHRRELFEYVGHEWSLLPVRLHPLLRWRMHAFANDPRWMRELPAGYPEAVSEQVAERGPLTASDLSASAGGHGRPAARFEGRPAKQALTWLTQSGRLAVAGRRGTQAIYDLAERVIPADVLATPTPERDQARRDLLLVAARALGVATAKDLVSYFLLGMGVAGFSERSVYPGAIRAARLVDELAAAGRLLTARVDGWRQPAFLHPEALDAAALDASPTTAEPDAGALLSPFDSLIWERERTERLFGFRYRSEIYVPEAKRKFGYYVLPYLLGDRLVARVDLRAERGAGTLTVLGAFAEPGVDRPQVAEALGRDLRRLASWLELATVSVRANGDLSRHLARRVRER